MYDDQDSPRENSSSSETRDCATDNQGLAVGRSTAYERAKFEDTNCDEINQLDAVEFVKFAEEQLKSALYREKLGEARLY